MSSLGPVSGQPISASGETPITYVYTTISETLHLQDSIFTFDGYRRTLSDNLVFSDQMPQATLLRELLEQLRLGEEVLWTSSFNVSLASELTVEDAFSIGFSVSLSESLVTTDSIDAFLAHILTITDNLAFSESLGWRGDFYQAFISGVILGDLARIARAASITDILEFLDSSSEYLLHALTLAETLYFGDSLSNTLAFVQVLSDEVSLSESLSWSAVFNENLESLVTLSGQITLGGIDYVAWVLNPANKAFSSYEPYVFNSFATIGADAYGFTEEGIFLLEGETDAGEDIPWKIVSGLIDFGTSNFKNVRHAYLGMHTSGEVLLKTITTKKGKKRVDYYRLRSKTGDVAFTARKDFSNAIQSRYWQFEIESFDGSRIMLDEIEWRLVLLRRKI